MGVSLEFVIIMLPWWMLDILFLNTCTFFCLGGMGEVFFVWLVSGQSNEFTELGVGLAFLY